MDPSIDITNLFMIINFNIIGKTIKNIIKKSKDYTIWHFQKKKEFQYFC